MDCGCLRCGLFDLGAVPFARLPLKKKKNPARLLGCERAEVVVVVEEVGGVG